MSNVSLILFQSQMTVPLKDDLRPRVAVGVSVCCFYMLFSYFHMPFLYIYLCCNLLFEVIPLY